MARSSDAELQTLVVETVAGSARAWTELWQALEPRLLALVRKPQFSGALSNRDDDCRNIVVAVMAKLGEDDHRRLRSFLDARQEKPGLELMPWLIVLTKRVAIDHLRARDQYIDRRHDPNASSPGQWIDNQSLPPESRIRGNRPPFTRQGTAREILSYSDHNLPDDQRVALAMWTEGATADEIATELALPSPQVATRLVRSALARLRRRYRSAEH